MRDLLLVAIFGAAIIPALTRPYLAAYIWAWLGLMSPQRQVWSFATSIPFSQLTAVVGLVSLLLGKQRKLNVMSPETTLLLLLVIWTCITTIFALNPLGAQEELERFIKIQLFIFITIAAMSDRQKLYGLVWVIVLSIGFYGAKGGLFTILTGGHHQVLGPAGTFIGDNNTMALANLMVIPLMRYLHLQESNRWIRLGLLAAMLLTAAAVLGSQSRGAFLGILAIGLFSWWKSPGKLGSSLIVAVVATLILTFMPQTWWDKMDTIGNYEEDGSAQGRLNAWGMAIKIANDRLVGGGARAATGLTCAQYADNPNVCVDFHSIYFEMLGEQGWIGFGLFVTLGLLTWFRCATIVNQYRDDPERQWAANLAQMVQVSLIGYGTSGAFLGLSYWDFPYYLIALAVITRKLSDNATDVAEHTPHPSSHHSIPALAKKRKREEITTTKR
ncbi:wzy family polymerase, exosortase system type 1 associated [Thiorhodococcus drewsii AZ1]|uniref:Wzy family polymerase, exosortase system type 1 associated n=1 Tax=Thiorhodococcus drewsii AZ1 TaxID=765913 RepID=G2E6P4_9GAMM|nr:putative O-glycosylation ligase, exosortase A system-associated [Thiorhodococcus drewsii]EGV28254.1 wzy family polymerase, exosortase system type 1 associated [Thiorhodococcus drewsii AZ1]